MDHRFVSGLLASPHPHLCSPLVVPAHFDLNFALRYLAYPSSWSVWSLPALQRSDHEVPNL